MQELLIIKTDDSKKIKSLLDQNQANYEIVLKEVISPVSKKSYQNSTKNFSFPPEKEIEKVLKRIEQPGYRRINIGLTPGANELDKTKYNLCLNISRYRRENNLSESELAQKLKISQVKLEYILFRHLEKLNLDELNNYTQNLTSYDQPKTSAKTH